MCLTRFQLGTYHYDATYHMYHTHLYIPHEQRWMDMMGVPPCIICTLWLVTSNRPFCPFSLPFPSLFLSLFFPFIITHNISYVNKVCIIIFSSFVRCYYIRLAKGLGLVGLIALCQPASLFPSRPLPLLYRDLTDRSDIPTSIAHFSAFFGWFLSPSSMAIGFERIWRARLSSIIHSGLLCLESREGEKRWGEERNTGRLTTAVPHLHPAVAHE